MEISRASLSELDIQKARTEKRRQLAVHNTRERPVFCNCPCCSEDPLFTRSTVINAKNARVHHRRDLTNCAPGERSALASRRPYVTLDNYLALYEGWLRGTHNDYGARLALEHPSEALRASQPSTQRNTGQALAQPAQDLLDYAYAHDIEVDNDAYPPY